MNVQALPGRPDGAAARTQRPAEEEEAAPAMPCSPAGPAIAAGTPVCDTEMWFDPALVDPGDAATAPINQHLDEYEDVFDFAGDMGDPAYF